MNTYQPPYRSVSPQKCKVRAHDIQPCPPLRDSMEASVGNKGILFHQFYNVKTHKPSRAVVSVRSGEYMKKTIAFNYCPFCGVDIIGHMDTVGEAPKAKKGGKS